MISVKCKLNLNKFIDTLNNIVVLSAEAKAAIEKVAITETFARKFVLIPELSKCQYLYFIEKGLARAYFFHDGKEITDWFGYEKMIIGPTMRNFPVKETSHRVELLEDSIVTKVSFGDLEILYQRFHEVERLGRLIAINTILLLQQRIDTLQLMTAKERYNAFLLSYPELINRVPLGYLASFLGMNQVTLSRIRNSE